MSTDYCISEDKELFEYLGRVLYECQRLEVALAQIISDGRLLKGEISGNDPFERLEKYQGILNSRLEQTLGKLISELRGLDLIDDNGDCGAVEKVRNLLRFS